MSKALLGLSLPDAQKAMEAAGQEPGEITVIRAPRGNPPRGTLRVIRVREGGRELVCAEFPDQIHMNEDTEKNESENA